MAVISTDPAVDDAIGRQGNEGYRGMLDPLLKLPLLMQTLYLLQG
jgi:hypothetical protein